MPEHETFIRITSRLKQQKKSSAMSPSSLKANDFRLNLHKKNSARFYLRNMPSIRMSEPAPAPANVRRGLDEIAIRLEEDAQRLRAWRAALADSDKVLDEAFEKLLNNKSQE